MYTKGVVDTEFHLVERTSEFKLFVSLISHMLEIVTFSRCVPTHIQIQLSNFLLKSLQTVEI